MSIQGNPFIIHDSSLVLSLDAANIKSFRGEPTVNIVQPAWSSWGIDGSGQGSVGTRTIYSDYYCRIVDSAANTRQSIWAYNASPSTTYTFSVKYRKIAGTPTLRFQIQPYAGATYQSSVFPTTAQLGIIDTDDWQTATYSVTGNASTDRFLWFMQDGDDYTTYTHTFELKEAQVEAKTYYTTFVSGSRGTTVATGGGLYDLTNGNNNGTLTNGPTFNSANGGSIVFDGSDDEIFIDNSSSINFIGTQRYTALIWVYPNLGGTTWHGIVSKGNAQQYALTINSPNAFLHYETNQGGIGALNSAYDSIDLNKWQQVGIGFDGSTKTIWKNGISIASQIASTLNSSTNTEQLRIGEGNDGEQFRGNIAQVSIYNKALSASEVLQNYNSAKSRFGL